MSLKFFLKMKSQEEKRAKVYLRIIVNRQKAEIATNYYLIPADWDEKNQVPKPNHPQFQQMKLEMGKLENKIRQIVNILEYEERPISARILKDIVTERDKLNTNLIEYYQKFIKQTADNPELSPDTVSLYKQTFGYVVRFTKEYYKAPDIPIKQLDYSFVTQLDHYLLKKSLKRNTINKHHSRFRTLVHRAINEGHLTKNPYQNFTLKKEKVDRQALNKEELEQLMEHSLGGNLSLQKVRDIFLFSVYTGLRYQDAQNIEMKDIFLKKNGMHFICIEQHKTGGDIEIPVLDPAQMIIDRYDNDERKITGKILPKFSNQKINAYLKVIADMVGIQKKLTHHVARHTCATTILLSEGVPLEAVSKWLGHTNVKQTEVYAKVSEDYLGKIAGTINSRIK